MRNVTLKQADSHILHAVTIALRLAIPSKMKNIQLNNKEFTPTRQRYRRAVAI
jgi:hypothetical protein